MCNLCMNNNPSQTTTTYSVDINDCVIIIKNVPCTECPSCGEQFFSEDVSIRLEQLVNTAKSISQEVSVIDYSKTA